MLELPRDALLTALVSPQIRLPCVTVLIDHADVCPLATTADTFVLDADLDQRSAAKPAETGIAERPGAERATGIAGKLRRAVGSVQGSFFTRFLLRNLLKALRVQELLMATDFIARIKTEPDAAREQLRAQVEPRLIELAGKASFRPLGILLAVIAVLTLTSRFWTKLYV